MATDYDIVQFYRQTSANSKTYIVKKRQISPAKAHHDSQDEIYSAPADDLYLMEVVQTQGDASSKTSGWTAPSEASDFARCPFASNLIAVTPSGSRMRYILDHANGGNLKSLLRRAKTAAAKTQDQILSDESIRLYAAEVATALSCLHSGGASYGSALSSDNILLDSDGHIMLSRTVYQQWYWARGQGIQDNDCCTATTADMLADWMKFASLVGELTGAKIDSNSKVILQTVSSAGVQSFLQDFYSHSGSSSLTIDIEWIKTHSFFSQLDFDQVTKRLVSVPDLPFTDATSALSPISTLPHSSPLSARPRANTASGRVQQGTARASPTTTYRSPFGTEWRARSSSVGKSKASTDSASPSLRSIRSPTSPDKSSPLTNRYLAGGSRSSASPSRSSHSPLRRGLRIPTHSPEKQVSNLAANEKSDKSASSTGSTSSSTVQSSQTTPTSSTPISPTSPRPVSPNFDSFSSSLMTDKEESLLEAVLSPMKKDPLPTSLHSDSASSASEREEHEKPPFSPVKSSLATKSLAPYGAESSPLHQRPRSMSLTNHPYMIKRQAVSESALASSTSRVVDESASDVLQPGKKSSGSVQISSQKSSPPTPRQSNKNTSSSTILIQNHVEAVAHFMSKSPVVMRRGSTPSSSTPSSSGSGGRNTKPVKTYSSDASETANTCSVGGRRSKLKIELPVDSTTVFNRQPPTNATHKIIDTDSSMATPRSPRITLTNLDNITTNMESLEIDLPPPFPVTDIPEVVTPPNQDGKVGNENSGSPILSPSPPAEFCTPPVAPRGGVSPPALFLDSGDDSDECLKRQSCVIADDASTNNTFPEANTPNPPDSVDSAQDTTDGASPVSINEVRITVVPELRHRTMSVPVGSNMHVASTLPTVRSTSALSNSSGIEDGDTSWSNMTISPTSNRHSYTSEESIELNWQWQERMRAITNRLDCMPESEEDINDNTPADGGLVQSQTEGDSSSNESPFVFTRRLSRLRYSTGRSSLRHSPVTTTVTSTDEDLDMSGSFDDNIDDQSAVPIASGIEVSRSNSSPRAEYAMARRKAKKRAVGYSPATRKKLSVIQSVNVDESLTQSLPLSRPNSLTTSRPASVGCSSDVEADRSDGPVSLLRLSRSPRVAKRPISGAPISPRASAEISEPANEVVMTERLCSDCHQWQPMEFKRLEETAICQACIVHRRKRSQALHEIVSTEETYGHSLEVLMDVFMTPMQNGLVTASDHAKIFLNVEELMDVHRKLLADLKQLLEKGGDGKDADENLHHVEIGRVILKHIDHFKAFHYYCIGSSQSIRLLMRLTKKSDLLRVFLRVCQMENDRCSKMGMQAFLLAPMQRITRYPLLLSKLLSHTAVRHPDKGALQQCMDQLANLLDEINVATSDPTRVRRSSSLQQTDSKPNIDISRLTTFALQSLGWEESQSSVVYHGELEVVQSKSESMSRGHRPGKRLLKKPVQLMYAILLKDKTDSDIQIDETTSLSEENDCIATTGKIVHHYLLPSRYQMTRPHLVIVTVSKENRLKCYKEPISLSECVVTAVIDEDYSQRQFVISYPSDSSSQTFAVSNTDVRDSWMAAFQSVTLASVPWKQRRRALANIMITTETFGNLV